VCFTTVLFDTFPPSNKLLNMYFAGAKEGFFSSLVDAVADHMGDAYPELRRARDQIRWGNVSIRDTTNRVYISVAAGCLRFTLSSTVPATRSGGFGCMQFSAWFLHKLCIDSILSPCCACTGRSLRTRRPPSETQPLPCVPTG